MFSKWVEAFPTSKQNAGAVAKALLSEIIPRWGIPRKISSDNGTPFANEAITQISQQVKDALPKPAEGVLHDIRPGDFVVTKDLQRKHWKCKRWNGPFQVLLITHTAVKVAERTTWIHASHCRKVPAPPEGFQPPLFPWSGEPSELPAVNSWFQRSEETWNLAHVHLQRAVRRTQDQANRRRSRNPPYAPGQWDSSGNDDELITLHLTPCDPLENTSNQEEVRLVEQIDTTEGQKTIMERQVEQDTRR
ncbi:hypothetical protein QQF64_014666 [Cirrhinus molitorella]|uniref:Integrase catalytic domain-containing protein n=1 Tax=Cirrhinus molitorella TaxID=172907 RepID=A0ABR3NTG1_9TELE